MNQSEQENLRALIVSLLTLMKSNAEMIARLSSELASVTLAVRGLDPTFDEVLAHRREGVDEVSDPITRATLARFDELILQIKAGQGGRIV